MKLFSTKNAFSFFIVILLAFPLVMAVSQSAQDGKAAPASAGTDETAIYLDAGAATLPGANQTKAPSSIWILIRVVLVLAIVCAAIYGVVWLLKKTTVVNAANDPYLKSVASITLAPNKTVQVVTVGSKAYLVGVTDQSISLIDEITEREMIDAMNLEADRKASAPPASFSSVLSSFLPGKTRSDEKKEALGTDEESGYAADAASLIRRQRERLSGSSPQEGSGDGAGNGRAE